MQLEQELEELKSTVGKGADLEADNDDDALSEPDASTVTPTRHQPAPKHNPSPIPALPTDASAERTVLGTLPRKIGDFQLDAHKIEGCIKEYAFLPSGY